MANKGNEIRVYSEIGKLKKVLVHRPGDELKYVTPQRIDELLMSAIIELEQAQIEHDAFTQILKDNDVEVVELADLVSETYDNASDEAKNLFINNWLDESEPKISSEDRKDVESYIRSLTPTRKMIDKMMAGILYSEINKKSLVTKDKTIDLIVDPMPNIYFTRDPFATVGNGITLHHMKYPTRQRETVFAQFIFDNHKDYVNTPKFYERTEKATAEGGDVFIYSKDVLAIGVSERTTMETIEKIANNIMNDSDCEFKKILAINVPVMGNLMHLDTWLTMLDKNKFLYSGNINSALKVWEIDLTADKFVAVESERPLADVLADVVGEKVVMIPIGGENASQMDIDIETHFDGTNYLVIAPGVVVGYDRNRKTAQALRDAGITVLDFNGNQLSLGMGSSRCMSMPLIREDVK